MLDIISMETVGEHTLLDDADDSDTLTENGDVSSSYL